MGGTGFDLEGIRRAVSARLEEPNKDDTPARAAEREEFRRRVATIHNQRPEPGYIARLLDPDSPEALAAGLAAFNQTGAIRHWPTAAVLRVMPPAPVYDHKSMRESGRPKPHIINPDTLNRTLCGKDFSFWRVVGDPAAEFDYMYFSINGCATCAKVALRLLSGREEGDAESERAGPCDPGV